VDDVARRKDSEARQKEKGKKRRQDNFIAADERRSTQIRRTGKKKIEESGSSRSSVPIRVHLRKSVVSFFAFCLLPFALIPIVTTGV
jgi:hypothetical protein